MFGNIYRKYLLRHIRDKEMVIWTVLFPIVLATLFSLAFSSLDQGEQISSIPVAVVEKGVSTEGAYLKEMLQALSEGEEGMLKVRYEEQKEAEALLEADEVEGLILMEDGEVSLVVKNKGLSQTILKNILDRYQQIRFMVQELMEQNPRLLEEKGSELFLELGEVKGYTEELRLTSQKPQEKLIYFYALLGMTCLYGGFYGLWTVVLLQGNLSVQGARTSVSPVKRSTFFSAAFLASFTVQMAGILVFLAYLAFVLHIDFGSKLHLVILLCFVGSVVGVAFGAVLAIPSRFRMNIKVGVLVCVSLVCSALSGLMYGGLKYQVEQHAPILAKINPASRIADGFYCLYYYDSTLPYWKNVGALCLMAVLFLGICVVCMRRKQYENI